MTKAFRITNRSFPRNTPIEPVFGLKKDLADAVAFEKLRGCSCMGNHAHLEQIGMVTKEEMRAVQKLLEKVS